MKAFYYFLSIFLLASFLLTPLAVSSVLAASAEESIQTIPPEGNELDETYEPTPLPELDSQSPLKDTLSTLALAGIALSLLGMAISGIALIRGWFQNRKKHQYSIKDA